MSLNMTAGWKREREYLYSFSRSWQTLIQNLKRCLVVRWIISGWQKHIRSIGGSRQRKLSEVLWKVRKMRFSCVQIRSKARALKEKFPLEACSKDVQEAANASKAAALAKRASIIQNHPPRRNSGRNSESAQDNLHPRLSQRYGRATPNRPRVSKFHSANEMSGKAASANYQWLSMYIFLIWLLIALTSSTFWGTADRNSRISRSIEDGRLAYWKECSWSAKSNNA